MKKLDPHPHPHTHPPTHPRYRRKKPDAHRQQRKERELRILIANHQRTLPLRARQLLTVRRKNRQKQAQMMRNQRKPKHLLQIVSVFVIQQYCRGYTVEGCFLFQQCFLTAKSLLDDKPRFFGHPNILKPFFLHVFVFSVMFETHIISTCHCNT